MAIYSLVRACWIVRKVDGSAGRLAVFRDVIQKSIKIRFSYGIYEKCPTNIKSILIILYGLKCYLSLYCDERKNIDLAFFASYPNEHVVLNHIRRQLHDLRLGEVSISKRNIARLDALLALPAFLGLAMRSRRMAGTLVRRFQFMPACRIFSAVTYYARCRHLMARNDTKAVFIANHYSPECLALAAAAHQSGRKVIFTNHANATRDTGFVAPLYSDLAALTSQALLDVFVRTSQRNINAAFVPVPSPQRPMRDRVDTTVPITIGIFLTALTNMGRLDDLVDQLETKSNVDRILIRPHPVAVVGEDLSKICRRSDRVWDTRGTPLFENIEQCDVAICGNSTVAIEILRGGVPVLYDAELDRIVHDYNGYVSHRLILPMQSRLDDAIFESLTRFYGDSSWVRTMQYFDAGYQQDEGIMYRRFNEAVRDAIQ